MRARVPADVPIHRASVGADPTNMGNRQPDRFHDGFKPYTYRGTGVDTLTPHLGEDWERGKGEPDPKPKPKRRKPKPKPKRKYHVDDPRHPDFSWSRFFQPSPETVAEQDRQLLAQHPPGDRPEPEPEPEPERFRLGDPRHPDHERYYGNRKPARPSPGWEPMKGDDIDALLDELG